MWSNLFWASAAFLAGSFWLKNKVEKYDPDVEIPITEYLQEDFRRIKTFVVGKTQQLGDRLKNNEPTI